MATSDKLFVKLLQKNLQSVSQPIVLISDGSIFSDLYEFILNSIQKPYDKILLGNFKNFDEILNDQSRFTIFTQFKLRVINVNFDRVRMLPLGEPYFIFINSNLTKLMGQQSYAHFSLNPLLDFSELAQFYLFQSELVAWLNSPNSSEPHNDLLDRHFVARLLNLGGENSANLYKGAYEKMGQSFEMAIAQNLGLQEKFRTNVTPLHRYISERWQQDTNLNHEARLIYGNVY